MKKQFTFLSILLLCVLIGKAQDKIQLVQFSTGFTLPLGIENCGDDRLFIVDQIGKIFIVKANGKRIGKPFLDISDKVSLRGEQGLLGLAFDPDYLDNGFFYINYIDTNENTQISRFKVRADNPNLANKNSEKFILNIVQPLPTHNGGGIRFGPDGYLYIGMGDGGGPGDPFRNAQNPMSLLGKMLRIDVHNGNPYQVPADNPFVDSANYKPEIWALGLRNPWRWSFDALNGNMYIADVGQEEWEEINLQPSGNGGNNYGWSCFEGKHPYYTDSCKPRKKYDLPIYEYSHATTIGDCSITGGFVYRGSLYPILYGKYFFTDYCSGLFRYLFTENGVQKVKNILDGDDFSYTSFGEDSALELYVCSKANGTVYRIEAVAPLQNSYASDATEKDRFSLSPNPSKGNINIVYTSYKTQQIKISVASIMGRQVYTAVKNVNAGANTLNLNLQIPKGNYYLSITNNEGDIITQSLRIE